MRAGWSESSLEKVCDLIKRGVAPKYTDIGGICVINQKCIRNHDVNYEPSRRHDITAKSVNPERYIRFGDVLVNSTGTGTLGRVAQVRKEPNEPTIVDTHVTIVRPKRGLFYPEFFGYMMIKIEDEITASGEGASGQTELPRTKLAKDFKVAYPHSIKEQKRIVAILDEAFAGIDTAITNTEKNLANARELFESYLNEVFTNQGNGWKCKKFSECLRLKSGDSLTSKKMIPGEFYVFGGNGVAGTHNEFNLSGDNVIIGRVGALCGNVRNVTEKIWLTDNAFKVIQTEKYMDNRFLTYLLNFKNLRSYARQSAQPVISNSSLKDIELNFPESEAEQRLVVKKIDALHVKVEQFKSIYQQKLEDLKELKQSLLQKAFSGELTAEKANTLKEVKP